MIVGGSIMRGCDIVIKIVTDSGTSINVSARSNIDKLSEDRYLWNSLIDEAMFRIGSMARVNGCPYVCSTATTFSASSKNS